ncbi:TonB family protein [Marinilabilia salmonicolor]|jgi:TonB family protein|uniref:TonB family protein n=1 Tax=Marinilabilia salmonicolor TaxID=989 RepID=UPI000D06426D|nr:TonB family protein [Marinilabilia salmonicolor]PRZ00683.1 TonB family protein [Marinilabilia salmonicolor]
MKPFFTFCFLFLFFLANLNAQLLDKFPDFLPDGKIKGVERTGVSGFIEYQYSGEASKKKGEANHFIVVFIDARGRITKSIEFNQFRNPEKCSVNAFDESDRLTQRSHFNAKGKLLWREVFYYDVTGKLTERVELADDGSIDGRTVYIYDKEGLLFKTRQFDYAGKLSFFQVFYYSENKLPERIILKQARGFTMSNTILRYQNSLLPAERVVSAGSKGPVLREEYIYDRNHLWDEKRVFQMGDLKTVHVRNYCKGNFRQRLNDEQLLMDEVSVDEPFDSGSYGFKARASFPNGKSALDSFLRSRVNLPDTVSQQGVVMVSFVVKPSGKVRKAKVQKGLTPLLNDMALKIVKKMPAWIPAKSGSGRPEKSTVYLPLVFVK